MSPWKECKKVFKLHKKKIIAESSNTLLWEYSFLVFLIRETRSQRWENLLVVFRFFKFLLFISSTKSVCLCECMCVYVSVFVNIRIKQHMCRVQDTSCGSCLSPSNHMDTGDLTEVIFLAASDFAFLTIFPAQGWELWNASEETNEPGFRYIVPHL